MMLRIIVASVDSLVFTCRGEIFLALVFVSLNYYLMTWPNRKILWIILRKCLKWQRDAIL